jgi:hypothetical protein
MKYEYEHLLAYLFNIGYNLNELNNLSFKDTIELLLDVENEIDKKTNEFIENLIY